MKNAPMISKKLAPAFVRALDNGRMKGYIEKHYRPEAHDREAAQHQETREIPSEPRV